MAFPIPRAPPVINATRRSIVCVFGGDYTGDVEGALKHIIKSVRHF